MIWRDWSPGYEAGVQNAESSDLMCYSCHDGYVEDSRAEIRIGYQPSWPLRANVAAVVTASGSTLRSCSRSSSRVGTRPAASASVHAVAGSLLPKTGPQTPFHD